MKKKALFTILMALILVLESSGVVQAEIIPPQGFGQIGIPAIVLCEELTVREKPSNASKAVQTLQYGAIFSIDEQTEGWANCYPSDDVDAGLAGWVNTDFIVIDPARYRTEKKTPVYAWNDTTAPKVALLDKDTILPILKEDGDWIVVSLRGATGWIQKTETD